MTFGESIKYCFKHPFTFAGRARRSEFWWFFLFLEIIAMALGVIVMILIFVAMVPMVRATDPVTGAVDDDVVITWLTTLAIITGFATLFGAVIQLFMLAPNARRLHDTDQSAHWLWFYLVGLSIVPILMAIPEGTAGPNKYGPDPKQGERQAWLPPTAPGTVAAVPPPYSPPPGQ